MSDEFIEQFRKDLEDAMRIEEEYIKKYPEAHKKAMDMYENGFTVEYTDGTKEQIPGHKQQDQKNG